MSDHPHPSPSALRDAAEALHGYLDFLATVGVTGLPASTLAPAPTAAAADPSRSASASAAAAAMAAVRAKLGGTPATARPATRAPAAPVSKPMAPPVAPAPPAPPVPVGPHTAEQGAADLRRIREDLGDCKRCKLWSHRKNIVFGVGSPAPEICFVGEGPGADEDRVGEPFVGAAGQLLTQMIRAMGFAREEVYICNIVKCRPPNNRDPEMDESSSCLPFVMRQVRAVRPRVIVTLGKTAAWSLLRTNVPISKLRGTWMKYEGIPLMPTFHPSYLLRDVKQKRPVWDDLRAVLRELGRPVPEKPKAGGGPGDAQR